MCVLTDDRCMVVLQKMMWSRKLKRLRRYQQTTDTIMKYDTVLFFDEANTSDAIGLIKEVMCDRRIHGRPIRADVKFIAACNPYRKLVVLLLTQHTVTGNHLLQTY